MFSLTVFVGSGMWQFLFKTEETAKMAFNTIVIPMSVTTSNTADIVDDFGNHAAFIRTAIHGEVLENLEETKLAHCERALHQQKVQIAAQELARADSTISKARNMQGPAILAPMGAPNGGRPF